MSKDNKESLKKSKTIRIKFAMTKISLMKIGIKSHQVKPERLNQREASFSAQQYLTQEAELSRR